MGLQSLPNQACNVVLNALNKCPRHEEGLVFAYLSDIKPDPYYGFQVFYNEVESVKAKYVAALVASPNNSQPPVNVGSGYKVTTAKIIDLANPDTDQPGAYTVVGYCGISWQKSPRCRGLDI